MAKAQANSEQWQISNSGGNIYLAVKEFLSTEGNDVAIEASEEGAVAFFRPGNKEGELAENLMGSAEYNKIRFSNGYDPYDMELPILTVDSNNKITTELSAGNYFTQIIIADVSEMVKNLLNGEVSPLVSKKIRRKSPLGR